MNRPDSPTYCDVVVVGGGPSGASAARAAASHGADTILVDRAHFPRYKTCGGGLIGPTLVSIPEGPPIRESITAVSFSLRGGAFRERHADEFLVQTVARSEFDNWLMKLASASGVRTLLGHEVRAVAEAADHVDVIGDGVWVRAKYAVGAEGTSSRLSRHVGVVLRTVDLGLELEVTLGRRLKPAWERRIHLDWGAIPGSYAWVFPKGDSLTVGVIAAKGNAPATKAYLTSFMEQQGLASAPIERESGHLTRSRCPDSPLATKRVLLVGDAAGLLEPWTREGISFAVRSGTLAGRLCAQGVQDDSVDAADAYATSVQETLGVEMAAGAACLAAFERHPGFFHRAIAGNSVGWRQFCRVTRGETNLARALERRSARLLLSGIARTPATSR